MAQPSKVDAQLADRNDKPMIGTQGAAITAASTAHALNATFSDVEVETALNALGTAINSIISRIEAHGLVADN